MEGWANEGYIFAGSVASPPRGGWLCEGARKEAADAEEGGIGFEKRGWESERRVDEERESRREGEGWCFGGGEGNDSNHPNL